MATMEEYLFETPERIKDIINVHEELMKDISCENFTRIILCGSGTSCHGGMTAKNFMQKYMKVPVETLYPYEINNYIFSEPETTLFIGISQTGTSYSTYRAMEKAKKAGCRMATMAGKNDEGVIINEFADWILTVQCGEEGDLQPKTKGFFCTIANLMLLALTYALKHNLISQPQYEEKIQSLNATAENMRRVLGDANKWIQLYGKQLSGSKDIRIVGTDDINGITMEGTLKLVETLRVPVGGFEFEEFIHGIYNAINKDSTIFLLDTGVENRVTTMKKVLSEWSDFVSIVGVSAYDNRDFAVRSAGYKEFQSIEYILLIFLICEKVSKLKGINILTTKDTSFHGKLGSKKLRA